jgi:hypothetical protein
MTEGVSAARRWWQVPFRALLLVPVACAPVFYYFAMRDRISPDERVERQHRWVVHARTAEFSPRDGERVEPGDMLVILAEVTDRKSYVVGGGNDRGGYGYYARSRWLMPDGMIHFTWNMRLDANDGRVFARADNLAKLPTLLRVLPPSDPAAKVEDRVIVAFPVDGRWVVRTYSGAAVPKEVLDLHEALWVPRHR